MLWLIKQGLHGLTNERRRQRAIRELDKLNDHLLKDIGLRREQLPTFELKTIGERRRSPSRRTARMREFLGAGSG